MLVASISCPNAERDLTLQYLEVLQVCVFGVNIELDSGHRNIKVNAVENLAEGRTVQVSECKADKGNLEASDCGGGVKHTQFRIAQL